MIDRGHRWYQVNARRYDRLHPGLPGDIEHYAALARGARVLELGAGTGRVTAALAEVARLVLVVDNAPAMLAIAGQRLRGRSTVHLLIADIRALPLAGRFDLVVLAYRTLQHLPAESRLRLWRRLQSLLAHEGRIAFDTWHGPLSSGGGTAAVRLTPLSVEVVHDELAAAGLVVLTMQRGFRQSDGDSLTWAWVAGLAVGRGAESQRKNSRSP